MERRDLSEAKKEYTTQKLRQEWAEHEEAMQVEGVVLQSEELSSLKSRSSIPNLDEDSKLFRPIVVAESSSNDCEKNVCDDNKTDSVKDDKSLKEESKSKKKRRKKSALKKKNTQRKNSSSSSGGSILSEQHGGDETETVTMSNNTATGSSTDESPIVDEIAEMLVNDKKPNEAINDALEKSAAARFRDLDIHFFSDTEVGNVLSPNGSRPSTPIQSDTEFEISQREKPSILASPSASWKWGELPTQPVEMKENVSEECKF